MEGKTKTKGHMVSRAWEYLMEFPMAKVIRKPVIRKRKILTGYNSRYDHMLSKFNKEIIGKKKLIVLLCLGCGGKDDDAQIEYFGSEFLLEKSLVDEILSEEEEDEECVDKRAEEFIQRFYKKMRLERQQSLENSMSSSIIT